MILQTPFFPQMRHLTGGRAPRGQAEKVRAALERLRAGSLSQLEALFERLLAPACFVKAQAGPNSRERVFGLRVTFWAFLFQVLHRGSQRLAVREVQAQLHRRGRRKISALTAAYSKALGRLPSSLLADLLGRVAGRLEAAAPSIPQAHGRPVKVVDATSAGLPDTPALQKHYPQPGGQKPGCGFPVVQLVGLFDLGSGALLAFARTCLNVHESIVFLHELRHLLRRGDIVLADRAHGSFAALALLLQQGVDGIFRLHQGRPQQMRRGRRLGKNDRLLVWEKPRRCPEHLTPEEWAGLPARLTVRQVKFHVAAKGCRTKEVILVTTLLDAKLFTLADLAALYQRRWQIELCFRDLKTTLGLEVLKGKSPASADKEITMHLIAHNLVRWVMLEAACAGLVELGALSFKGSLDAIRRWSGVIDARRRQPRRKQAALEEMLRAIAADRLPRRPHRCEPRVRKRRMKKYKLMVRPRAQMRRETTSSRHENAA
jgi:hypothetical protein